MILPQMQKRQKGAIVNVASGSELQPLPLMSVYAASKVSCIRLANSINWWIDGGGIVVTTLHIMSISEVIKVNK